jgi:hypothetical protein
MAGNFREPFVPEGSPLLYKSWANYPVYNFSYSMASDVDKCGEYTILSRFMGLTTMLERATFKFGICCEEAVVEHLRMGADPEKEFSQRWIKYKDIQLEYGKQDTSWNNLFEIGKALMRKWYAESSQPPLNELLIKPRFGVVCPEDQYKTWYNGTRLDYIADLIVYPPSGSILLDLKTSGKTYDHGEEAEGYPALDPQLQCGALATGIREVGFIALVKTKTPKIEFVRGTVTDKMLESRDAWLKDQYHKLIEKKLYMRSGVRWPNDICLNCDFLPKCLGREDIASKTLRIKQSNVVKGQLENLDD